MDNLFWILWCILGAVLIVAEVFTSGFVLLWFGIGALAAALAGLVGIDSLFVQFLIFIFVSVGLTAASRTIFVNYFSREKTGDSLRTRRGCTAGKDRHRRFLESRRDAGRRGESIRFHLDGISG